MIVDQAHTHHISPTRPHPGHQAPVASAPMLAPTPLQKPPLTNDANVNMEGSNSKDRIVESDEERETTTDVGQNNEGQGNKLVDEESPKHGSSKDGDAASPGHQLPQQPQQQQQDNQSPEKKPEWDANKIDEIKSADRSPPSEKEKSSLMTPTTPGIPGRSDLLGVPQP